MSNGLKIFLAAAVILALGVLIYIMMPKQTNAPALLSEQKPVYNQAAASSATGKVDDIMAGVTQSATSEQSVAAEGDSDAGAATGDNTTINSISQDNYANF